MTLKNDQQANVGIAKKNAGLVWLVVFILLSVLGVWFKSHFPKAQDSEVAKTWDKPKKVAVSATHVMQQDVPMYLNGLGTVTALRTVTVRSRIDGELIRVAFTEGQMVKAGDLLAEIDPRAYEVQLQQAEGQLQRDAALLKNAETDLQRYKTLLAQDSISAQQTVTQESLVKQYQGTVTIDMAAVASAKLQLSYTKITAPISGRLGLRLVDQGNMIHANDANGLAVITQIQPISVVFTLPEDSLPMLMQHMRSDKNLTVEAFDRSGKTKLAQGNLLALDNQIDLSTGTVKLKSQFTNSANELFANQFVNVKMRVDTLRSAITVNNAAIQNGATGAYVYVIQNEQTVNVRPVKLGAVFEDQIVVLEGLQLNEKVVLEGADKLRDGDEIKLIDPNAKALDEAASVDKDGANHAKHQHRTE